MAYHDTPDSRTSSPSLSERVRSLTALRTRFSSASRTTLVDDQDAETVTAEESDHGSTAADRLRGASAAYPGEYIFDRLQPSKSLGDRIDMIERVAGNAGSYPVPVLMSMWRPIHDMYREDSPLEARKACLRFATSIANLDGVSIEVLQQLYRIVAEPIPYELLQDQVRSLKALTGKGTRVNPFIPDLTRFLIASLPRQFRLVTDLRKRNKAELAREPTLSRKEPILSGLLSLVGSIDKLNPGVFQNKERSLLLQELFNIAEKTSSKRDMKDVVKVLGPIVRTTGIPQDLQRRCMELLCAMANAVEDVKEESRASILFLLRSDSKDDIVRILLETLSLALSERHHTTVCGALAVLLDLIKNRGQDGLPLVTFGQFIEPFSHVHYGSRTTRNASLQTISEILADRALQDDVLRSDWKFLVDTILTATGDELYEPGQTQPLRIESHRSQSVTDANLDKDHTKQANLAGTILEHLQQIASTFNSLWFQLDTTQKSLVAKFYKLLVDVLPQKLLLSLIEDNLSASSGKMEFAEILAGLLPKPKERTLARMTYIKRMDEFIPMFVKGHRISPLPYGRIMEGIRRDFQDTAEEMDDKRIEELAGCVHTLLGEFMTIQGGGWQKAVELAQTVAVSWRHCMPDDFAAALELMTPLIYAQADEEDRETLREADAKSHYSAQHGMAKVTLALVDSFLHYLPDDPDISTMLFEKLMQIASDRKLSANIQLPALRLLARVRCDQNHAIFITSDADSLNLAPYLKRTENSRHQFATFQQQEKSPANTPTRTSRPDGKPELRRSRKSIDLTAKPTLPLWMYPGGPGLPQEPPALPSNVAFVCNQPNTKYAGTFNISEWLRIVMDILQNETDWEVYSYVIVHLPSQLANSSLFASSIPAIRMLRNILVSQLLSGKFVTPPPDTHVMKGDIAFCLMQTLIILLGYAEHFSQGEQDELIKVFLHAIGTWERINQSCVQALAVACHTIPVSIKRTIGAILLKLERYITSASLTVDILELLGGIARVRQIYADLIEDDYRKVFAICIKFLESSREERSKLPLNSGATRDYASSRWSGLSANSHNAAESRDRDDRQKDLPQYVFVLAYHVITIWFVTLKLPERSKHVGWISSKLAWKDVEGIERMEEQSQVTLDMMLRIAYSNLGETKSTSPFTELDGKINKKTWLVGLSIVTVETAAKTGLSHITKRQASGTTYTTYIQNTAQLAAHDIKMGETEEEAEEGVFPQHIFLQLNSSISPTPSPLEPVCLPDDAVVKRALDIFDRMDTVDGYRIGVVYVKDGQFTEEQILSNECGSHHFKRFMDGLGTKVALEAATFNTQGLDTVSNQDGYYTYAWRDRLVEIVYHVPSMMPSLEHDLQYTNKKRHIGNNFVTIVWNESGRPYEFDTIASQFNWVNIVITPENSMSCSIENDGFYHVPHEGEDADVDNPRYKVQTFTSSSLPRLSPCASAKLLPLTQLSAFVRQMALNSAIFSNVWSTRSTGEYVSSWRNRLREIVRLRENYANKPIAGEPAEFSGARGSRVYKPGDLFKGKVEMGGITEEDGILGTLDFSRWAGPVSTSNIPQLPGQNINHGK